MRPRLPPLNALKAFEAAARHESFTRAAEELCVTQGAVSHQVKALEAELAVKLFNRERQRLIITEAGAIISPSCARRSTVSPSAPSGCCSGRRRRADSGYWLKPQATCAGFEQANVRRSSGYCSIASAVL